MEPLKSIPTPSELAASILKARDDCQKYQADALETGDVKTARKFDQTLRSFDKLITQYGLNRSVGRV